MDVRRILFSGSFGSSGSALAQLVLVERSSRVQREPLGRVLGVRVVRMRRSGRLFVEGLGGVISDEVERQPGTVFRHEEVGRLWRNPELFESIWVIYYGRYGEVIE